MEAYPTSVPEVPEAVTGGLTKRERFAMAAMQGLVSHDYYNPEDVGYIAENATQAADALLKQLEETGQ